MLTPAGKAAHSTELAEDAVTQTGHAQLDHFYATFLPINGEFKSVCQAWQMRSGTQPNDHSEPEYDSRIVDRLAAVDAAIQPQLDQLSNTVPRFGRYTARLTAALERVREGDNSSFARPMYDSYHDIWMELHQDLLLSLNRERGEHDEG
jgi:hypothetical protein